MGIAAAFFFRAVDEKGQLFENDRQFVEELRKNGIDHVLRDICGLNPGEHDGLLTLIKRAHKLLARWDRSTGLGQHLRGEYPEA